MASSLTASNINSGSLYFLLLAIIVAGVFYLFIFSQPSAVDNLNQHAFRLNKSAFENGVRFANAQFLTNNPQRKTLDQWVVQNKGLDFNRNGFPIGTNIKEGDEKKLELVEQCLQVWQFILGPLRPKLYLSPNKNGYWVEINQQNICIYHPGNLTGMQFSYHALTGEVILNE